MKPSVIFAAIAAVVVLVFAIYMIDIDQTEETRLPDVDVSVEGGQLPEFKAEVGDIDTGTKEVTVTVPTVDIQSPEEEAAEEGSTEADEETAQDTGAEPAEEDATKEN